MSGREELRATIKPHVWIDEIVGGLDAALDDVVTAILASDWLAAHDAEIKAAAVEDLLAYLAATPAVTITGKGGATELLRARSLP